MQLWTEINVVTLQKLIETMPWGMCVIIKAKGLPTKHLSVILYFWQGSVLKLQVLQQRNTHTHTHAHTQSITDQNSLRCDAVCQGTWHSHFNSSFCQRFSKQIHLQRGITKTRGLIGASQFSKSMIGFVLQFFIYIYIFFSALTAIYGSPEGQVKQMKCATCFQNQSF